MASGQVDIEVADSGRVRAELGWRERAETRCRTAFAAAQSSSDRLAIVRSWARLRGGRLDFRAVGVPPIQVDAAVLTRFGLAMSDAATVRLVVDAEDEGLQGLVAATALDAEPRQVFEPAAADGVLLKLTDHERYRSAAQKSAARALLTQPPGSGLMVSMPTGSGKSLLFQIAALQGRRTQPGACVVVITPTIALAMDHARTLSGMRGLEESRALTGDTAPAEANAIVDAFRRGEIPVLLLSPEKALNPALAAHLAEAATGHSPLHGLDARLTHLFVDEAHIIESWGRSFRPDFQRLPSLLTALRQANPEIRAARAKAIYAEDEAYSVRKSHENPAIETLLGD